MDMRGYGDSDKPRGRGAYKMEKLVDDVHQLIHKLGINLLVFNKHKTTREREIDVSYCRLVRIEYEWWHIFIFALFVLILVPKSGGGVRTSKF